MARMDMIENLRETAAIMRSQADDYDALVEASESISAGEWFKRMQAVMEEHALVFATLDEQANAE